MTLMNDHHCPRAELASSGFDHEKPRHFTELGGDSSNPTWKQYLLSYKNELQPYISAIKECIKRNEMVGKYASEIYSTTADLHFVFEDGTRFAYTWRAWGDLMQSIVDKREGYMRYY